MSNNPQDKLVEDLKQIKREQEKICEQIERIKENTPSEYLEDVERIERDAYNTVIDIDKITENIGRELSAEIERNTILFRMSKPSTRSLTKIGHFYI